MVDIDLCDVGCCIVLNVEAAQLTAGKVPEGHHVLQSRILSIHVRRSCKASRNGQGRVMGVRYDRLNERPAQGPQVVVTGRMRGAHRQIMSRLDSLALFGTRRPQGARAQIIQQGLCHDGIQGHAIDSPRCRRSRLGEGQGPGQGGMTPDPMELVVSRVVGVDRLN